MTDKPSILFACRANAGRSLTGKVLAQHYAGSAADALTDMRACSRSQFSPEVVSALVRVVSRSTQQAASDQPTALR